jgi:hypothetical protein
MYMSALLGYQTDVVPVRKGHRGGSTVMGHADVADRLLSGQPWWWDRHQLTLSETVHGKGTLPRPVGERVITSGLLAGSILTVGEVGGGRGVISQGAGRRLPAPTLTLPTRWGGDPFSLSRGARRDMDH